MHYKYWLLTINVASKVTLKLFGIDNIGFKSEEENAMNDIDSKIYGPEAVNAICEAIDLGNLGVIAPHKDKYLYRYNINWLIDEISSGQKHSFVTFWQADEGVENRIFSQWYPHQFSVNGRLYETAEQYMMSEKALLFGDFESYKAIMDESNPKICKQLGRTVKYFDSFIWNKSFREIIWHGNLGKLQGDIEFVNALLSTGDAVLIEASPVDDKYGAGLDKASLLNPDGTLKVLPQDWHIKGETKQSENNLGFVLMGIRDLFNDLMMCKGA